MSEIRFLTSSDEHIADRVAFRKDDYRAAILSKIHWQGVMAAKFNATAVIRGGDFFHIKTANRTSMATLVDAMSIHGGYKCPTYSIIGNHDISYNDPTTLSRQPLGVLFESRLMRRLTDEVFESGSLSVRVIGVDYVPGMTASVLSDIVKSKGHAYTIAVVHALAEMSPTYKTQSFFNEEVLDYRDLVFSGCPDVYVFGHYHKYQSVYEHLGVKFINLGAVARGALIAENLERKPKVALIKLDGSGISIEEEVIPHEDAQKVFDLERKQAIDMSGQSMNIFLEKLRSNASMVGGFDMRKRVSRFMESSDFTSEEKDTVREILEAAEAEQG